MNNLLKCVIVIFGISSIAFSIVLFTILRGIERRMEATAFQHLDELEFRVMILEKEVKKLRFRNLDEK